jgi:peptide/nickel transport system substrate-binding protein
MHKRLWLSVAMLAIGAGMLAATGLASPDKAGSSSSAQLKNGGTLKFSLQTDIDDIDPARSYYVPEWQYEWITGRTLLAWTHKPGAAGKRLYNDAAKSYTVSRDGRTYTFHLRHGIRFSNGSAVTAANFKHAFLRILNPAVGSPGSSFITDPQSINIVGATAYNSSGQGGVAGLQTKGKYTFIIKLVKPAPILLSFIAMPFTMAEPTSFPMKPIVSVPGDVSALPSAGKYYVSRRVPNRTIVIKRNKYYKPLGAPVIPGHVNEMIYTAQQDANQTFLQIKKNQVDWGVDGLSPTVYGQLKQQYGIGPNSPLKFFHTSCYYYVAMNTTRSAFGSVSARKAINYGFSRNGLTKVAGVGAGKVTSQILTDTIPGYKHKVLYPAAPKLSKARGLAKGHTGAHVNLWYTTTALGTQVATLEQSWLKAIGYNNIDLTPISSGFYTKIGRRGADYDIARAGWCMDFPDPYDYVNKLFSGTTIQAQNNNNLSYFQNKQADRLMQKAAALRGAKRYKTYNNLANTIMKKWAPVAPYLASNDREFFSKRVDPHTIKESDIYNIDIGQLALK